MTEEFPKGEIPDTVKAEHLKEGERPIFVSIERRGSLERGEVENLLKQSKLDPDSKLHDLDFYGALEELARQNIENDGRDSYVMSPVDNWDKYSKNYANCTGVIVTGRDKETDENISFMTHQDPDHFLSNRDKFTAGLSARLQEIKKRCKEGSIDAVMFGGRYANVKQAQDDKPWREAFKKEYLDSIKFVGEEVTKELGFEPVVVAGPKVNPGMDAVFYENKERRMHLGRSAEESFSPSFKSGDIEKAKKDLKPGEWRLPM